MIKPKRRSWTTDVLVAAPVQQVWQALTAPDATRWIVTDGVLAVPVPGRPEGLGALYCTWQWATSGAIGCVVNEVIDFEPEQLIAFTGRNTPQRNSRVEFRLDPEDGGTRVHISFAVSRYRYEWVSWLRTSSTYVHRLAESLTLVLEGRFPAILDADDLLVTPEAAICRETHEIEIAAPFAVVWEFLDDTDGSHSPSPTLERQWSVNDGERELLFSLTRDPDPQSLRCTIRELIRHRPNHVIERGVEMSVEHEVISSEKGTSVVRSEFRWDPKRVKSERVAALATGWHAMLKDSVEAHIATPS